MNIPGLKESIASEVSQINAKLDKLQCILDTYAGDRTKLRMDIEKRQVELATWEKCLHLINQFGG